MYLNMETCVVCARMGEEAGLQLVRAAGFDGVDYSFFFEFGWSQLEGEYLKKAAHTKALLEKHGLACRQAHAPFRMTYEDALQPDHFRYEEIRRSMEYAAILGAKQIIIHPLNVPEGVDYVQFNVGYLRSFEAYAKEYGIRIAAENGPVRRVARIVEQLDETVFVYCLDTGHANSPDTWTAQDSIAQIPAGRLQALHINDNRGIKDHATDIHFPPFYGTIDWQAVAQALAKYDYPGDFTLEIVGFLEQTPTALLPEALALAHKAGRELIRMVQQLRQEK